MESEQIGLEKDPCPRALLSDSSLRSPGRWAWSFGPRTFPGVGRSLPLWDTLGCSNCRQALLPVVMSSACLGASYCVPWFWPMEQCQTNSTCLSTIQLVVAIIMLLLSLHLFSLNALISTYSSSDKVPRPLPFWFILLSAKASLSIAIKWCFWN